MSETKWTAGPWRVDPDLFLFRGYTQISGANHHGLAQVVTRMEHEDDSDEITEELEANARLIAAAPELYAALDMILHRYVGLVNCGDCGNWNPEEEPQVMMARAALAKARGE